MPPSRPDRRGQAAASGFDLPRAARRGSAVGAVAAALVFLVFALLPGTSRPLGLYVGLAFVLAVSIGLLATLGLVGWQFYRLSRPR